MKINDNTENVVWGWRGIRTMQKCDILSVGVFCFVKLYIYFVISTKLILLHPVL